MKKDNSVVTIHNVADAAGVSISTVSRVVNGLGRVAPSTRRKVEKAVEQLDFAPNSRARALSRKCTDTIGLIVPDFKGGYFTELMEGAHREAQQSGKHIVVLKAKGSQEKIEVLRRLCSGRRADAVILMLDELNNSFLEQLGEIKCPLVVLDRDVNRWRFDNILVDNRLAGFEATAHFIDVHDTRNLIYVGGPENNVDTIDRLHGFEDAIEFFEGAVDHRKFFCDEYQYDSGYKVATEEIASIISAKNEKWGIVAANDDIACGLIDGLVDVGIEVPQKVGVIGFDDSDIAVHRKLKITTMRIPVKEVGHAAVRMIVGRLMDASREPVKVILKAKLVVRQSCGCNCDE